MAECYCNNPQYILFEIFSKRWQLPLELNSTPLFDAIFFPFWRIYQNHYDSNSRPKQENRLLRCEQRLKTADTSQSH